MHWSPKHVPQQSRTRKDEAHVIVVFGICLGQRCTDRIQVRGSLRGSNACPQPSYYPLAPASAVVQTARPVNLLFIHHGRPKIGCKEQLRSAEPGRCNTKNRVVELVQLNNTVNHSPIALEMALPVPIAQHNVRSTVGPIIIGAVEETAKIRLNPQYVELIPACLIEPDRRSDAIDIQPRFIDLAGRQPFEASIPVA